MSASSPIVKKSCRLAAFLFDFNMSGRAVVVGNGTHESVHMNLAFFNGKSVFAVCGNVGYEGAGVGASIDKHNDWQNKIFFHCKSPFGSSRRQNKAYFDERQESIGCG